MSLIRSSTSTFQPSTTYRAPTPQARPVATRPLGYSSQSSFTPADGATRPASVALGGTSPTNPVTAAGTRPSGWASLSQTPLQGADLVTVNGAPQPAHSGWYVVACSVSIANHTSIAYYDAATQTWSDSTAIQGGQSVPTSQSDLATNPTNRFFPITMGPVAASAGVTQAQFDAMMRDDLHQLAANYGSMNIPYNMMAPNSPELDQNCNAYTSYLLQSLGADKLNGWLLEYPGMSVIGRDDAGTWGDSGALYIDTVSKGQFTRDRYFLNRVDLSQSE